MKCQKSKLFEQVKNRKRFSTKAQSISINTIVVAAIALVVMILIIMIATGNLRGFFDSTKNCQNNGAYCTTEKICASDGGRHLGQYDKSCTKDDEICCLSTSNS